MMDLTNWNKKIKKIKTVIQSQGSHCRPAPPYSYYVYFPSLTSYHTSSASVPVSVSAGPPYCFSLISILFYLPSSLSTPIFTANSLFSHLDSLYDLFNMLHFKGRARAEINRVTHHYQRLCE